MPYNAKLITLQQGHHKGGEIAQIMLSASPNNVKINFIVFFIFKDVSCSLYATCLWYCGIILSKSN